MSYDKEYYIRKLSFFIIQKKKLSWNINSILDNTNILKTKYYKTNIL